MLNAIASFDGRLAKVAGPARTGKTEALVRRAARLLAEGTDPASVLMEATTAEGARVLRGRLADALAAAGVADAAALARAVTVTTARQACLDVLAADRAQAATGRVPRVLAPFEYNFFLEDMKTLGSPLRRLRALLSRFQEQWAALPAQPDWVAPGEEQEIMDHAQAVLTRLGAMLPDEVAYVCARYLQSDEGRADAGRYDYVLCDDFQNLSHAEQTCLGLLARRQLIVAGNADAAVPAGTRFPDARAFADFEALRRDVTVFELTEAFGDEAVTAFCHAVAGEGAEAAAAPSAADAGVATVKWGTPEDEFNGLTRCLLALTEAEDGPDPASVAVVVPNKQWARAFEQMLGQRGFAVAPLGFDGLAGDPRDKARAAAMMACTALNLIADPDDAMAWRLWTGYGNYLTRSDGWASLAAWADEQGLGAVEALAEASRAQAEGRPEPFLRAASLAAAYDEGRALIERCAGKRGFALLAAVGAQDLPAFRVVREALVGDEDATTLYALVRAHELAPVRGGDLRAVTVSSPEMMVGCSYDLVLFAGCVDGFMPARDAFEVVSTDAARDALMASQRRTFAAACATAGRRLLLSTFSQADLELAEVTKMQVVRIRMEDDRRVASMRPTCFIAEAGAAAPLTVGGQALLAELGID